MSTILEVDPELLRDLEMEIQSGDLEKALRRLCEVSHALAEQSPQYEHRYNQLPQLDRLVQEIGRLLAEDSRPQTRRGGGKVNIFIATELYRFGGHSRVLEDLTRFTHNENIVILTDFFGHFSKGILELGPIASRLDASIFLLPQMQLIEKTRNLIRFIRSVDVNTIGILAHPQDGIAYAACTEALKVPQAYIHHADHRPTLGATISHYRHLDLFPGNELMCRKAGFATPMKLPILAVPNFQDYRPATSGNSGTSGSFNKFSTSGPLNYADIVVAVLSSASGNHVHVGEIPQDYLEVIRETLISASIDPGRFIYLGTVDSLPQALLEHNVGTYITSAPTGGGKAYEDVLTLGIAILLYKSDTSDDLPIMRYSDAENYGDHLVWRSIKELSLHLRQLDIESEFHRSRTIFEMKHSEGEFAKAVREHF